MSLITSSMFAKAMWPGVNSWYGKAYNEFPVQYTQLFDTFSSDRAYEQDVGLTGFGLARVKGEGAPIEYDSESQAYTTTYRHLTYALGFQVSREAMEDDQYNVVAMRGARNLAFSMRQTKEIVAANVYNRATASGYTYGDGAVMLGTHTNFAGGTQSNLSAIALSEAALEDACIKIMDWTDDRGLRINYSPKTLIVPPELLFEAQRILKTEYRVAGAQNGTANYTGANDINALYSLGKFPGGVVVNNYLTDGAAWFVRTNCPEGMKHFERRADSFAMDNDFSTENARYKATARYSFGMTDWRGVFGKM